MHRSILLISRVYLIKYKIYETNARIQKMQKLLDEYGKTIQLNDVRILRIQKLIAYKYYDINYYFKA